VSAQTPTPGGATTEASASASPRSSRGGGWVVAQVVLIAAIVSSALLGLEWSDAVEPFARAVGGLLLGVGVIVLAAAGVGLGSALTPFPAPRPNAQLRTSGIYAHVRHPMYGGGIVIGLGWSIIFATPLGLVLTLLLAVFADLKSRREERWLEQTYPSYGDYRARVRHRLIPFIW
jgi:protein-S-isoprenylcysteine O-methyltransferase Ste14